MANPELPNWPGADSVYHRLGLASAVISADAYKSQRSARVRSGKRGFKFIVPEAVDEIIAAMNSGDEEQCKALLGCGWVRDAYRRARES